jgi:hypothetical protein
MALCASLTGAVELSSLCLVTVLAQWLYVVDGVSPTSGQLDDVIHLGCPVTAVHTRPTPYPIASSPEIVLLAGLASITLAHHSSSRCKHPSILAHNYA